MQGWKTFVLVIALARVGFGADHPLAWPQFRGPNGSAVADDQKPPVEVGPDKNVKWKVAAPSGLSSPIVVGDLLVFTAFENEKLFTIAYHRADGREAWRAQAPAKSIERFLKTEGSPAASTPATDGKQIVSYFGSCGLFCYDLTGKELWKHELPPASTVGDFGSGSSPVIVDGSVVLMRDETKDPKITAFDLETGKPRWERKRESKFCFSTPAIWDTPSGKQIVAPGYGRMIGYDAASGDERWTIHGMPAAGCTSPSTSQGLLYFAGWSPGDAQDKEFQMPTYDALLKDIDKNKDGVLAKAEAANTFLDGFFDSNDPNHDGKITRDEWDQNLKVLSASKNSAFALKPGGSGEVSKSHIAWKKTRGLPYVASGVVYRGQYVLIKDGGLVTAYDAKTGAELYVQKRAVPPNRYYASPVAANGNIYFTALEDGAITVLKAGAAKPEVVMENPPLGERAAATPAIADDTLYVRTAGHLYAFANAK